MTRHTASTHPHISSFDRLTQLPRTARELGYRMPAEWAPQSCVWLVRPFNSETWPGCMNEAVAQWDAFAGALSEVVPVSTTQAMKIETVDSWIRDFGPIFVTRSSPESLVPGPASASGKDPGLGTRDSGLAALAAHDFRFNGWGGKYEDRTLDDVVPQELAHRLGFPVWVHDFVLEGGSIEVSGAGTVMTTEQCLLNDNRNPHLTKADIEARLHDALGTSHVIWLPGGIVGDDTDGHIDDIARFVNETTVVAVAPPAGHPDYDILSQNLRALRGQRDQDGRKLEVVELPAPEPIEYCFPPDRFGPGGVNPVPASHANFLISNGSVFLPVFGGESDDAAVRVMEQVMPGYRIVPLRADKLVVGLGSFHCLSQQQPRV